MPVAGQQVFVLEDQPEIGRLVCRTLEDHGFRTEWFPRARTFLSRIRVRRPDLCIVDLGLPDEDGLAVIRDLHGRDPVPVIILTGRADPVDRVLGLELGADDYVVKPFDPRELIARVKAVLRRSERALPTAAADLATGAARFGGWICDFDRLLLTAADGNRSELSAAEARLLLAFCRAPNRILSRESLLGLRGPENRSPFDRSIDVRISRLRQKLEHDPKNPQLIKTVYGAGYIFAADVEWSAGPG
jgi:DNA-binding response OmpR family regulator